MTEQTAARPLVVRAKKMVFYGGMRVRAGATFTLTDPAHFSEASMERVAPGTVDDTARAVEASPKQRTETGSTLKQGPRRSGKGSLDPDPGI